MKSVQQRLSALREAMKKHGVDAFVIPSADPHLSEYLPEHWQARRDFSGFTGSAGTLVVTADKAGVWTDSRYWEQAGQQLAPNGIELQKWALMRLIPSGWHKICPRCSRRSACRYVRTQRRARFETGTCRQKHPPRIS